jgi:hypothetical protein
LQQPEKTVKKTRLKPVFLKPPVAILAFQNKKPEKTDKNWTKKNRFQAVPATTRYFL